MQVYLQTRRTAIICIWRSATAKWSDSGIELAYRNTTSGQNVQKWKRSFECTLGKRKHPIPQSANLKVSDARQGNPKGMPCPYCAPGGARFQWVQVPNPPGSGKDIAEGKGVHREVESEGSWMWGIY